MNPVKRICVLPGDGIGPEVTRGALIVLDRISQVTGFEYSVEEGRIGGDALDKLGNPLPDETLGLCRNSDAVLLGAVGGPAWDSNPADLRPERGLLELRKGLGLYGNLRPVRAIPSLLDSSTLKRETVAGVDLVVVRELTGGLYFGTPRGLRGEGKTEWAVNSMVYHRHEIERIARHAFELARLRRRKVTSVDKANVLEVSRLWRRIVEEIQAEFTDVELSHQYVDNCAMQMVLRPTQFDVVLTENTFGDILSDIGAVLTGSIGTLPSASIGDGTAVYEPVHGSAPDIAGKNRANPMGAIGCLAMMFEISFGRLDIAAALTESLDQVVSRGQRTQDLAAAGQPSLSTDDFALQIADQFAELHTGRDS